MNKKIQIITKNCHYCNAAPSLPHIKRSTNGLFISNGIDRLDSNIGYIYENCVPCCRTCNVMKNVLTHNEFITHIERILTHAKKWKN